MCAEGMGFGRRWVIWVLQYVARLAPTTRAFSDEILEIAVAVITDMTTEHYIVFKRKNWLGFFKTFMAA